MSQLLLDASPDNWMRAVVDFEGPLDATGLRLTYHMADGSKIYPHLQSAPKLTDNLILAMASIFKRADPPWSKAKFTFFADGKVAFHVTYEKPVGPRDPNPPLDWAIPD